MTSELKCPVCPYCGKPLHCGAELNVDGHNVEMWHCTNYECEQSEDLIGTREMWELVANRIQAKQDLEIAVETLKRIKEPTAWGSLYQEQELATEALTQIEHKE